MNKIWLKYSLLSILTLVIISLILSIRFPIWQSFRIVFGSVYLLFLPGFVWSWIFWKKGELDVIERFLLSFALSMAIVPLVTFFLNKIGIRINLFNLVWEILGVTIIGQLFYLKNKHYLIGNKK